MEVPKNKIIRIKTKEEVLQKQQQKLAPMFNTSAVSATIGASATHLIGASATHLIGASATHLIPVSPTLKSTSVLEEEFLKTLDEKEMIAYNIAKSHLGLLFSLDRSNCYLEWLENKK